MWNSSVFKRNNGTYKLPFLWIKLPMGATKQVYARRFAWEMETGRPLKPDTSIVNVCGEQLCVKPHEKHNIPVKTGSWNMKSDKRDYQLRQGLASIAPEPVVTLMKDGGVIISQKLVPDSEEEFMK